MIGKRGVAVIDSNPGKRSKTAGIYLAAGSSSRMGEPKQALEPEPGRPLGGYALRAALASRLDAVFVVVREKKMYELLTCGLEGGNAEEGHRPDQRLHQVLCPEAAEGMSRSLRCGAAAAEAYGSEAAVVLLADQPFVRPADIDALLGSFENDPSLDYAALTDDGQPKPPLLLARSMFAAIAGLRGDTGARALLRDDRYRGVQLQAIDTSCFLDADTPDDLERIMRHLYRMSV
jgi:molybdenum cofactor cytidylyltransferase